MKIFHCRSAAILATSCLFTACTAISPTGSSPDLNGTAWVLSALPGHTLQPNATATARFEDGRVQGTDGCNRYAAPYSTLGSTLQVGPKGASTQMACPPALMKQAEAFTSALTRASTYRLVDGQLQLLASDSSVVASFAAQSQSLVGTVWRVTGYNNGKQAVVSVLPGTSLTAVFSDDRRVSGSAGCNNYTAQYTHAGSKLTIGPTATTRKICAVPERVMEQEQQFLKALETVATARIEGDRLELRTDTGALAATLTK